MVWWSKYDENVWHRGKEPPEEVNEDILTNFDHCCDPSIVTKRKSVTRLSSFIVTLGRTCKTAVDMKNLIEAGMNIARIRFSRISKDDNIAMLKNLRQAAKLCCDKHKLHHWPVAVAVDLKSCTIRTGILSKDIINPTIFLEEGSELSMTCDATKYHSCNESLIYVDYPYLTTDIKVGTEVIVDVGEIVLTCVQIVDDMSVRCTVYKSGRLGSMRVVSLRGVVYTAPNLPQRDIEIVNFAKDYDVDILIVPYVRKIETLIEIKKILGNKRRNIKIISKICTQQGLDNFEDILEASDGIMLAREFICFELIVDRAVMVQKMVAGKCRKAGKPIFISGNVLEDLMLTNKLTCTDVSDITNALLDGVDGFMIKDVGAHITTLLVTIVTMAQLCKCNENIVFNKFEFWRLYLEKTIPLNAAEACAMSCVLSSRICGAAAILLVTVSGQTAQLIASLRPLCPVLVVATNEKVARTMHLYRGMFPILYNEKPSSNWDKEISNRVTFALDFGVNRGFLRFGEPIVVIFRMSAISLFCDSIQIIEVTSQQLLLWKCDE